MGQKGIAWAPCLAQLLPTAGLPARLWLPAELTACLCQLPACTCPACPAAGLPALPASPPALAAGWHPLPAPTCTRFCPHSCLPTHPAPACSLLPAPLPACSSASPLILDLPSWTPAPAGMDSQGHGENEAGVAPKAARVPPAPSPARRGTRGPAAGTTRHLLFLAAAAGKWEAAEEFCLLRAGLGPDIWAAAERGAGPAPRTPGTAPASRGTAPTPGQASACPEEEVAPPPLVC